MDKQPSGKKVYLFLTVKIAPRLIREFNEFWARESLPFWLKHGARHVASFQNYAGGSTNEILRLFEFDNLAHWGRFQDALADSDEGKEILKKLSRFELVIESRLLHSIY